MIIQYPAIFEAQEEGGYTVTFPDLPEAVTEGDTMEEALFNASEALTLTLDGRMEENMAIPVPSDTAENAINIAPSAKTQAALLVRLTRGGQSMSSLARAMETSWPSASRLENPKHWPSLKQLDKAAKALGKHLILSFDTPPPDGTDRCMECTLRKFAPRSG